MIKHLRLPAPIRYVLAVFTAMTLFIAGAGLSPANAAAPPEETVTTTVKDKTVTSETDASVVGLTLPGTLTSQLQVSLAEVPEEYLEATRTTPIASTRLPHSAISSYETDTGVQTLIRIDSAQASHEYRFPLNLPERATAELIEDGSILIKDTDGEVLGGYSVPWAIDANDTHVSTRFALEGAILIQTIDFTPETAFPVVADPNGWLGWLECVAVIAGVIAGNGLVVTKIAKIGGVAKLAKKLISAGSDAERWWTLGAVAGYITGGTSIVRACR